jgi:hypothetical protein
MNRFNDIVVAIIIMIIIVITTTTTTNTTTIIIIIQRFVRVTLQFAPSFCLRNEGKGKAVVVVGWGGGGSRRLHHPRRDQTDFLFYLITKGEVGAKLSRSSLLLLRALKSNDGGEGGGGGGGGGGWERGEGSNRAEFFHSSIDKLDSDGTVIELW